MTKIFSGLPTNAFTWKNNNLFSAPKRKTMDIQAHTLMIVQFLSIYILLFAVMFILRTGKIYKSKELFLSSVMMTLQLILAGLILTALFENPHPLFCLAYLIVMISLATRRILVKAPALPKAFQIRVAFVFIVTALFVSTYFILIVARENLFNPRYLIPITGMLIGNAMTGFNIALKTLYEQLKTNGDQIHCLAMLGVHPKKILHPFINNALETALIPTINSMVSMGIIILPGMLTGQILAGALPNTAILYQVSITIAICITVALSVYLGLHLGQYTLYDKNLQINP